MLGPCAPSTCIRHVGHIPCTLGFGPSGRSTQAANQTGGGPLRGARRDVQMAAFCIKIVTAKLILAISFSSLFQPSLAYYSPSVVKRTCFGNESTGSLVTGAIYFRCWDLQKVDVLGVSVIFSSSLLHGRRSCIISVPSVSLSVRPSVCPVISL